MSKSTPHCARRGRGGKNAQGARGRHAAPSATDCEMMRCLAAFVCGIVLCSAQDPIPATTEEVTAAFNAWFKEHGVVHDKASVPSLPSQ